MKKQKHYVLTEPEGPGGYYNDWHECLAARHGTPGVRRMEVSSREEADAIRSGKGVVLPHGLYAFTDANHFGGVGVVIVRGAEDESDQSEAIRKIPTCVSEVFAGRGIPGLEAGERIGDPEHAMRHVLRALARRWLELHDEIKIHTRELKQITTEAAPQLLDAFGIGSDIAAEMLITAGDNADRVRSEAAFAKLCGVCPILAGSGKTNGRHHLNRGGFISD